jgi:hypothetical protein
MTSEPLLSGVVGNVRVRPGWATFGPKQSWRTGRRQRSTTQSPCLQSLPKWVGKAITPSLACLRSAGICVVPRPSGPKHSRPPHAVLP